MWESKSNEAVNICSSWKCKSDISWWISYTGIRGHEHDHGDLRYINRDEDATYRGVYIIHDIWSEIWGRSNAIVVRYGGRYRVNYRIPLRKRSCYMGRVYHASQYKIHGSRYTIRDPRPATFILRSISMMYEVRHATRWRYSVIDDTWQLIRILVYTW